MLLADNRTLVFLSFFLLPSVDVSEEQQEVADSLVASMDLDCAMFDEEGSDLSFLTRNGTCFLPVAVTHKREGRCFLDTERMWRP